MLYLNHGGLKVKKILVIMAVLSIAIIFGCSQHKSPAAITDTGYSDPDYTPPGTINSAQVNLHLCSMSGIYNGPIVINSQAEYNAYIANNNVYGGLTYTPAPYPVDYSKKTLLGYVYAFIGGPFNFKYENILTDGKSATVNVKVTSVFCPGGPQYLESCATFFTVTGKLNVPVVFQFTDVTVDCDGNTMSPLIWQPCPSCTPGTLGGCVDGPVTFTAFTDGSGFPAPGFYSNTRENIAIKTQAEYDAFIASHYAYYGVAGAPTPVPVDFSKKALIAVFMGQMPNTCYSTDIDSITGTCAMSYIVGAVPSKLLDVNIKETYPPMGAMCGQMITSPAKLVLVDNVNGGIFFKYLP
jgi:hypothetical protein